MRGRHGRINAKITEHALPDQVKVGVPALELKAMVDYLAGASSELRSTQFNVLRDID